MRTMIMILALAVPLAAQEAKEEPKKETVPQKVVRHLQDGEWRKFEAAHRRAHSKRSEEHSVRAVDKRKNIYKKQQIKNVVRLAVVGGLAYYIGYHQGEKHFKGGMKRKPYYGDRK